MSTTIQALSGVRIDRSRKADRVLRCLVCKGEIAKGEKYSESGSTNAVGEVEYWVNFHPECLSLVDASQRSRAA